MDHDLALIVGRAATEHAAVANDWLEWARLPKVERIPRLYVVVAVDHDRRERAIDDLLGNNDGVTTRLTHLNALCADATELSGEPLGGCPAIRSMLREGRDARDLQELRVLRHP